jgi:hypothetical protein
MARSGPPMIELDARVVEELASIGATKEEIAAVLGCSVNTLQRRAKDNWEVKVALETGRAKGRASLRRLQWNQAKKGNTTMLLWLGKQLLDQRDHARVKDTGETQKPTKMVVRWVDP